MSGTATVLPSGDLRIDGILYGAKWSGATITFSFPTTVADLADYGAALNPGDFDALDASRKAIVVDALRSWSRVAGVNLVEAPDAASADIRIYFYEDGSVSTARVVAFPGEGPEGGDIQLGAYFQSGGAWDPGDFEFFTLLHEVGHALGLKHPHDPGQITSVVPAADDSVLVSVMSYRSYPGQALTSYTIDGGSYPFAPMMNDIAAIQYLYGPNWTTNDGDTTYIFDPAAAVILATIWDGGGVDSYNLSNYTTDLKVDLRPGAWSDLGMQYATLDTGVLAPANLATPLLYQNDPRSLVENVQGGLGDDSITGNAAANYLEGGAGDDTLDGAAEGDVLVGGAGLDTLAGGDGADSLSGGTGADKLTGDEGVDTLAGGDNNDALSGGLGADVLEGDLGDDTLAGEDGDDSLSGGAGSDTLAGGEGGDTLEGGDAADRLTGGGGADVFMLGGALAGVDTLTDFLPGDRIVVSGATGALSFSLAAGVLTLDPDGAGGAAAFTATLLSAAPNGYELGLDGSGVLAWRAPPPPPEPEPEPPPPPSVPTGGADRLQVVDAEPMAAGPGDDWVTGSSRGDWIHGNQGDDALQGGEGGDTVLGGQGRDEISGDAGDDQLFGDADDDRLFAGSGDDFAQGGVGDDVIDGGAGDDLLYGGQGDDDIRGGVGADQVRGDLGDDLLNGAQDDDYVQGGAGMDTVQGGDGQDLLYGGKGDDLVEGGDGADYLWGDLGDDRLAGGAGADRFAFVAGHAGHDVVVDFSVAAGDRVELHGVRGFQDLVIAAGPDGATITLPTGDVITLLGLQASSLDSSAFLFG